MRCASRESNSVLLLSAAVWPTRGLSARIGAVMGAGAVMLILVLFVLAVHGAGMSPVRAEPPRFSILATGIAHGIFAVRPADAEPFSGHAFKIDLDVAELRLVPAGDPSARRTVEQIVAPYPVVVAVNASFFDKEGRAMGLAVDEGRVLASSKQRTWGAFVIDGQRGRIML